MYKFFVYFRGAAMKIKITSGENYAVLGLDGAMLNSLNKNNTEYLGRETLNIGQGRRPFVFQLQVCFQTVKWRLSAKDAQ